MERKSQSIRLDKYNLQRIDMTIIFDATLDEIIMENQILSSSEVHSIIRNEVNPGKFSELGSLERSIKSYQGHRR